MSEQVDKMTQAEREALFARVAGIQSLIDRGGTDGEIASAMAAASASASFSSRW